MEEEFVTLRRLYPTLPYLTYNLRGEATEHIVSLQNFTPRCYFLQDSGFCDIDGVHVGGADFDRA